MINFLKGIKLWKHISTKLKTAIDPVLEEEWESANGKLNSWLANFVDRTIGFQLAKFAHPKNVWDYLGGLYVQTNSTTRYHLEQEILNAHQGDDSFRAFM